MYEFVPDHVIPSLIGYIITMLNFNCGTWSLIPEHNFWQWAKLTSIFLVISVRLEQQSWFQVCVVPMVPITSCFIILLTWCDRGSITSSWNLSTNVSWSPSTFWCSSRISIELMMRNTILALDDLCCHRPLYCVPSNKNLFVFCVIPRVPCYLAFVLLYHGVLPSFMSRRSWGLLHLLRILGMVILLTLTILSWYPCCF